MKTNLKQMVYLTIHNFKGNDYCYSYNYKNSKGEVQEWECFTSDLGDIYNTKNNKYVALWWLKKKGLFLED